MNPPGRLRVLVVTRNLPPLVGGMERLIFETIVALSKEWEVAVVGPIGCESFLPSETITDTVPPAPLWTFLPCALGRAIVSVLKFKPDLILSGSGLTVPLALIAAKLRRVPVLSWLHGLDIVTSNRIYQSLFVPEFRHCRLVLANSRNTAALAQQAGMAPSRVRILHPGVSIPGKNASAHPDFRSKYGLGVRPVILSVGRLTRRKGLAEFIEQCLPEIVRKIPDVLLFVVGDDATASARGDESGMRDQSQQIARRFGVEEHVRFCGTLSDAELHSAYLASSLNVFPVLDLPGDVEGFGMVATEASAHGVPTVAFRVGGVPDAVSEGKSGWLIEPGDYRAMTAQIVRAILQPEASGITAESCREHAKKFCWQNFGEEIRAIARGVVENP